MDDLLKINYQEMIKKNKYIKQDNSLQKLIEAGQEKVKIKKRDPNKYLSDDEKSPDKIDEVDNDVMDFISFRERKYGNLRKS